MASKKVCFVVQRYGLEINGGAELHCRQLAEHLKKKYPIIEIDVLTSMAIDYMTWKNEYTEEVSEINGIHVIRFSVEHEREQDAFNKINAKFLSGNLKKDQEEKWVEAQGPAMPGMIRYLKEHKDDYDVFIFCTYLYYQTVMGVKEVARRAIVVPDAHDEPYLNMDIFKQVFMLPKSLFFNTEEEKKLVHERFHNQNIPYEIGGAGVELPLEISAEAFRKKYNLNKYILYVGRIDEGKNCDQLFQFYKEYKKNNVDSLKLVLMGNPVIPIPDDKDIISLGFVSEEDKFNGIAGAFGLVLPSKFESLSIVVLEAMSLGTSVIVNGECPVLKAHCINSNGALYYNNYYEFEAELQYLQEHPKTAEIMKRNAKKYVDDNYQWDVIIDKLYNLIHKIIDNSESQI